MENKPPYFDLTTLKAKPFHIVLLSTAFAAFGVYTPLFFFVSTAITHIYLHGYLLTYYNFMEYCNNFYPNYTNLLLSGSGRI